MSYGIPAYLQKYVFYKKYSDNPKVIGISVCMAKGFRSLWNFNNTISAFINNDLCAVGTGHFCQPLYDPMAV